VLRKNFISSQIQWQRVILYWRNLKTCHGRTEKGNPLCRITILFAAEVGRGVSAALTKEPKAPASFPRQKFSDISSLVFAEKYSNTFATSRIYRVLTMVHNTQNHWDSGLCPSSGILNTRKHNVSVSGSFSVLRWGKGDNYSVGSLRRS
jgi:hypothetical protein